MSSFLVSHATVDAVLSSFDGRDAHLFRRPFEDLVALACPGGDPWSHRDLLGRALLEMNVSALEERYPSHHHPEARAGALTYVYRPPRPLHRLAVIKACDCLIYQCSEGTVPERPLFVALSELRQLLADDFLMHHPTYTAAPWGFPDGDRGSVVRIA